MTPVTTRSEAISVASDSKMILREVIKIGDPVKAAKALVAESVRVTGATTGRLYWLNVSKSTFGVMAERARSDGGKKPEIDLKALQQDPVDGMRADRPLCLLEEAISSKETQRVSRLQEVGDRSCYHHAGAQSRVVVPVVREGQCVGLLDLDCERPDHFQDDHLETLGVAAGVAALLFEKHEAMTLLRTIQRPISFHQPWNEFVDELILLAAEATRMPYLALREWDRKNRLECIGQFGFDNADESQLDLEPLEEFPPFFQAVTLGEPQVEPDMKKSHLDSLRGRTVLDKIQSFIVAPVKVGETVFGTLSTAAECPYTYTDLEKNGLVTVANAIGVAISNYRHAAVQQEVVSQRAQVGAALTAVEVAQAARHEARNLAAEATLINTNIYQKCGGKGKIDRGAVLELTEKLGKCLIRFSDSMDKIKSITRPPESERQPVSLQGLWREAFELVNARLSQLRVTANLDGPDVQIEAYPDHLRQAFLNLILNSIDAFKSVRRRRDRQIRVYIESASDAVKTVHLRYRDNATGIDQAKLRPAGAGVVRPVADVFEPGVTSKTEGSGYGLYLVRRILGQHNGSVEIKDWRNGVAFEISVGKQPKSGVEGALV